MLYLQCFYSTAQTLTSDISISTKIDMYHYKIDTTTTGAQNESMICKSFQYIYLVSLHTLICFSLNKSANILVKTQTSLNWYPSFRDIKPWSLCLFVLLEIVCLCSSCLLCSYYGIKVISCLYLRCVSVCVRLKIFVSYGELLSVSNRWNWCVRLCLSAK